MALTDYTTSDDVRATLGVSRTELPNTSIETSNNELIVVLALEDVSTDIPTEFATVSALPSGSRTTAQQRFYDLVKLFSAYALSKSLLTSLPMFGVQRLTDGKAEFQRQADTFNDLKDGIDSALNALRYRLGAAYQTLFPGESVAVRVTPRMTAVVALGTDPVTNA